jgi:hypothetical protein
MRFVIAKKPQHIRPSSSGLTGRPSIRRGLDLIFDAIDYWIPAFAGMTTKER